MILVTGATGKVGSEAVRVLRHKGVPVRAFVRSPGKAQRLAQAGAAVAVGDLGDPSTLDRAMAGVTGVILVSPGNPAQEIGVIDRAVRAGVGHLVKVTSDAPPDSPIARRRWHAEIEAALVASGLPHTLLRSNAYMQNFFALAPAIANRDSFGSSTGAGRIGLVDARDVAAVAAEVAAAPATHVGQTYWLTGPDLVSYADAADVLSRVLGRPISYRETTFDDDKQAMIGVGIPEPVAQMNAQALGLVATGDAAWLSDDVPSILGRPARSFDQFVTDYAAAFT
jgi:uncharacterized protein YbjT (DUF2867 family)